MLVDTPLFELDPSLAERSPNSIIETFVTTGLQKLRSGAYEEAGQQFRHALALQPKNVAVNFLNALTYHQLGSQGDPQQFESAVVGYQIALQFDPQAWWVAFYYGALELERQNYPRAQDLFAQAVTLRPDDGQPLLGLAIASYYVGDLDIAAAAIQQAREVSPDKTQLLRASALISAAVGDDERARGFVEQYQLTPAHPLQVARLQDRLKEWRRVYAQVPADAEEQVPPTAAITTPLKAAIVEVAGPRQILIEATVVRSTRSAQRRRGINLLDGLTLQFSYSDTSITDWQTAMAKTVARTVTRGVGIPELTYSLNIFNTTNTRNEIVARPTLLATEDQPSSFFSGDLFIASLQGTIESAAFSERVGVRVEVTPTFLSDDEVLLKITLGDSDFTTGAIPGTFDQALSVSAAETSLNARVKVGQTLLLAGLTERRESNNENKVPVVGDIPLLQTIFRQKDVDQSVAETMILLTPRRVVDLTAQTQLSSAPVGWTGRGKAGSSRVEELRRSYLQPFTPQTNFRHLLFHISESSFFQQFRRGDLELELWHGDGGSDQLWDEIIAYIYF